MNRIEKDRALQRGVRDILATVCVEWYFDLTSMWWSAWLLLWTAIGLVVARAS